MSRGMTPEEVAAARRDLQKLIQGRILEPGDAEFGVSVTLDNGRIRRPPNLVVVPAIATDIASVVRYCGRHEIRLTTKSGGHGASGYCLNDDGIVLDLSRMRSLTSTKPGTISAEMGARWLQVYNFVRDMQPNLVAVGGGCSEVGLGGFLLGGGFSFLSRSYGLGCDSIGSMEFVSADGDVHHLHDGVADPKARELLWALRGAGGGNFGIVSRVDLALHELKSPAMLMGGLTFPFDRAAELLQVYREYVRAIPSELAVYGMLRPFVDPRQGGDPVLSLRFSAVYNGDFPKGVELLKPLIVRSPTSVEVYRMTLPQWESFVGNGTMIEGRSAYVRSVVMPADGLSNVVIETLIRHMCRVPSAHSYIVWTHAGGHVRDASATARSSFAHRDAEFVFELKSIWSDKSEQVARANVEWAVEFFDELEQHSRRAYANYIDPLLTNWQEKYYGPSYARLLAVKEHWDPDGRFYFQQGIGSEYQPTRTVPLDISALNRT